MSLRVRSHLTLVSHEQSSTSTSLTLNEEFTDDLYDKTSPVFAEKSRLIITRVSTKYLLTAREGNVFRGVWQSFYSQGVSLLPPGHRVTASDTEPPLSNSDPLLDRDPSRTETPAEGDPSLDRDPPPWRDPPLRTDIY